MSVAITAVVKAFFIISLGVLGKLQPYLIVALKAVLLNHIFPGNGCSFISYRQNLWFLLKYLPTKILAIKSKFTSVILRNGGDFNEVPDLYDTLICRKRARCSNLLMSDFLCDLTRITVSSLCL